MSDTQAAPAADSTTTTGSGDAATSTTDTGQQATTGTPTPADLAARAATQQQAATSTDGGDGQRGPTVDMTGWPQAAIDAYKARDEQANTWHAEAVKTRVNAKAKAADEATAATLQKVAQALGLAPADDAPPSIDTVTAELQTTRQQAADATKDAALLRAAIDARVDPGKLDYLQFLATREAGFRDAAPDADGFADTVAATVRNIVAADPTIVTAAPSRKSGADTYGGASGSEITQDAFASMNAAERSKLYQQDPATYQALADGEWQRSRR